MVQSGVPVPGAAHDPAGGVSNGHAPALATNGHANGFGTSSDGGAAAAKDGPLASGASSSRALDAMEYDGEDGFVPLWEGSNFDRREFVRLALQAFEDMGYRGTAEALQAESGFTLEAPAATQFRSGILGGRWEEVEALLSQLPIQREEDLSAIQFAVRQQKFLEAMEAKETKKALSVLRNELATLSRDSDRLHFLSSLVMCSSPEDLRARAGWDGVAGASRQRLLVHLQDFISPSVMLPQHRLATLLSQSQAHQQRHHAFPSSPSEPFSLLADCEAEASGAFPDYTTHILREHTDEVWRMAWSHNGEYLATAGKDRSVVIWRVKTGFTVLNIFREHTDAVSCVAWSPDDSILLTAAETVIKMWNTETGVCIATLSRHEYPIGALAWLPDGQGFVSGGMDLKVYFWDLAGNIISHLPSSPTRVIDLAVSPDGSKLVCIGRADTLEPHMIPSRHSSRSATPAAAAGTTSMTPPLGARHEKRISVYDLRKKEILYELVQAQELTSVEISNDSRHAIVSHAPKEILYLELETGTVLRKFAGHDQGQYILRSCFGGALENFVLSGSGDGKVFIYHRDTGRLLHTLTGHARTTVNAVAWNPSHRAMWASCSDDHTVRIWEMAPRLTGTFSEGSSTQSRLRPLRRG
ncbi:hypothetical protein JCM1841_002048 [Sporobolomyces salmonicolor]